MSRNYLLPVLCVMLCAVILSSCDDSGGSVSNRYTCENGVAAPGMPDNANVNNCSACNSGYQLQTNDNSCVAYLSYLQQPTPVDSSLTTNGVQLAVTSSQRATLHWVVYEDGATAPTAEQLISDATAGSVGFASSGGGVSINNSYTIHISGLEDGVAYDAYTVLTPATGAPLLSQKVDITTEIESPVFVASPTQSGITQNSVAIDFTVNNANKLYWALYESKLADATALRIVTDANDANSVAINSDVLTVEVNKAHTVTIAELSTQATYYYYVVAEDEDEHQTLSAAIAVVTAGDKYVCLHGTPVDGDIMAGENITKCDSCNAYFRLATDSQCIATKYFCTDGTVASGSPQLDGHVTTDADVELCRGTLNVENGIELLTSPDAVVPHGVWGNGNYIWMVNYPTKTLIRYHTTTRLRDTSNTIALNDNNSEPHGIWSDGSTIWVADWTQKKLFAYTIATGVYDSSKDITLTAENDNPRGVWGDGTTIRVVDRTDTKLYAYDKTDGTHVSSKDIDLHTDNVEPRGVWGDDSTMWVADWDKQRLFAYTKSTGAYDSDADILLLDSNAAPRGVWGDGTTIWVADRQDTAVYAYGIASKKYDSTKTISLHANNDPRGLWSDGTTLWVTELGDGSSLVYGYDIASGEYSASDIFLLSVENQDPGPLWGNGDTIWVLDRTDRIIYAYNQNTKQRQPSKDIPVYWRNKSPQGMWGDGTIIWVSDRQNDKEYGYALYAYDIANRKHLFGSHIISLAPDNRHPNGIWGDGTTIWVTDNVDDKLYAYTIATKAADSSKDLDLSMHNGDSHGIWSNGTAMWIADDYDALIYRYYW